MSRAIRCLAVLTALAQPLVLTGCGQQTSRWDEAQQQSKNKAAVAKEAVDGSAFNKFFPEVARPFDLVYKQEKQGTAIASLKKDGKEVATLTIFDTLSNPEAVKDYKETTQALAGYPLVAKGSKGTALLVAGRFQVQVRSTDDSFTETDRKEWLKKFDLDGLAKLA